eukprot:gene2423-2374_t
MQSSLAITALMMGVLGGPHCMAMCGMACAGLGQAAGERRGQALLAFQLGRLGGYSLLGAVAAASVQGLGWLTTQLAAIRPVWTLLHLAAFALGLLLMLQARQPVWLDGAARRLWARVRAFNTRWGRAAPWMVGGLWALMPCGLLYSALMVAALTSQPLEGAATMALFALGSGLSLWAGPWLFLRMQTLGDGAWGMRASGFALSAISAWALWMGLVLHLSASAQTDVPQDWLVVSLSVQKEGLQAPAVQRQLNAVLSSALAVATPMVKPGALEVRTGEMNVSPRYGRDGKINGWTGSAQLVLQGRDVEQITTLAGRLQELTVSQIDWLLSPEQQTAAQARIQAEAVERFQSKAQSLTKQFGFAAYTLREVRVSAQEAGEGVVMPRMAMVAMDAAPAPLQTVAGKSRVVVNISGSITLR